MHEPELGKQSVFLRSFEDYITDVVARNHTSKHEDVVRIVKNSLTRSIQANVDYHEYVAEIYHKEGDTAAEAFHKVMSDIYLTLLK